MPDLIAVHTATEGDVPKKKTPPMTRLFTTPMLYTQTTLLDDLQPQKTEDLVGMALKSDLEGYHTTEDDQLPAFPIYNRTTEHRFPSKEASFLKILLKGDVADRFIKMMKDPCLKSEQLGSASVFISPVNSFFPGTTERVCTIRSVNFSEVHRLVAFLAQLTVESSSADCLRSICLKDEKPSFRMAVPRKVIGTIIGREGLQIQKLRQGTTAHIHISPLFVSSDTACTERVISVVSRHLPSLIAAAQKIADLINQHPDRARCRRLMYDHSGKKRSGEIHVIQNGIDTSVDDFLRAQTAASPTIDAEAESRTEKDISHSDDLARVTPACSKSRTHCSLPLLLLVLTLTAASFSIILLF